MIASFFKAEASFHRDPQKAVQPSDGQCQQQLSDLFVAVCSKEESIFGSAKLGRFGERASEMLFPAFRGS